MLTARKDDATPQEPREFCKLHYTRVIVCHILTPFPKLQIPAQLLFFSWMCATLENGTLKSSYISTEELSKLCLFFRVHTEPLRSLSKSRPKSETESELSTQKNTMRQQSREEEKNEKKCGDSARQTNVNQHICIIIFYAVRKASWRGRESTLNGISIKRLTCTGTPVKVHIYT